MQMSWGRSILDILEESHGSLQSGTGVLGRAVGGRSEWAVAHSAAWAVVKVSAFLPQDFE